MLPLVTATLDLGQHVTLSGNLSHVRFCGVAHNEARRI
jgi:hypothetical protein